MLAVAYESSVFQLQGSTATASFTHIHGGPNNGYPVLFGDNFGNSAPILTIISLLQADIYGV